MAAKVGKGALLSTRRPVLRSRPTGVLVLDTILLLAALAASTSLGGLAGVLLINLTLGS